MLVGFYFNSVGYFFCYYELCGLLLFSCLGLILVFMYCVSVLLWFFCSVYCYDGLFGFGICLVWLWYLFGFFYVSLFEFGLFVVRFVCVVALDVLLCYWWLRLVLFGCCDLIISGLFTVFDLFGFYVAF